MKVQEEEARNTVCCYHHLIFIFTILLLTLALRLGPTTAKLNVEAIIVPVEYKAEKQLYRCTSGQIERASRQATSQVHEVFSQFRLHKYEDD